ncbi:hypothetical protein A5645_24580 [Mycobacterium asiaticum]|uniref:serine/threonine-protein kinase n=1 Tax=Mycobacterium asiaticum TaxID=1790 RepID=UPI0007EF5D84|nr:serine/threonine-protein kinase [Mycobacterium asiaticum]OBK92170.1 hypothetical protein A5645_24580 [Mycobacterium asiaticum]
MPLNNGEVFAGYVIQRLLGTGGMSEVYLAEHPRLPRQDALKILSLASAEDQEFRARFIREAELAATLWHPHIVGVLDRGEFNGRLWISMEYVDGADAGRLVRERHPRGLAEQDVFEIVTAVADALDFGHDRRLLHRDVKPENILVTAADGHRRRVLLTDFGIARKIDDVSNLTEANVAVGTISYVAPEQLLGKSLDGRADQYALAATTYFLLTGAPPFQDSNRAVVLTHHLNSPPPRISERRPELAHLDAVLIKALAKDPSQRYPTCADFAQSLTQQAPKPADSAGQRPATQRLERLVVHGTARGVQRGAVVADQQVGTLSFHLVPYDELDNRRAHVPVQIQTDLVTGQLEDGDEVEVSGFWDGDTLDADKVVNLSLGARPKQRRASAEPPPAAAPAPIPATAPVPTPAAAPAPKRKAARIAAVAAAVIAVIVLTAGAVLYFTRGAGNPARPGPIVKPVSATVFSPDGAPDNPQDAKLAIDGDPDSGWSTVTYRDAEPFPRFIQGMGLLLHLPEPTALSVVTLSVSSTGTEVQIRSSATDNPAKLSDTTELAPTASLEPGKNRITISNRTKTSNVLVWISKLGTTNGESRTKVSDIILQATG